MSQGGRANPYSGQASLGGAASHSRELLTGGTEVDEPGSNRPTELQRIKAAAKKPGREEIRTTGHAEPQPGGTAAQLKAGAEYLEKEVRVRVCLKTKGERG